MNIKGCFAFYDPNGGYWPDGSTEPRTSPTKGGILQNEDRFHFPEGTNELRRDGYRMHTSISFFNVPRYYTANGKGEGLNTAPDYNNSYGYDCWPYNAMELTKGGHDENYFAQYGLGLADGDSVTFYACWDPLVIYHFDDCDVQDFVYLTGGNEYTVLAPGDDTRYTQNRSDSSTDGYDGLKVLPSFDKKLKCWKDKNGNEYIPHKEYNVTEPLDLYPVWE